MEHAVVHHICTCLELKTKKNKKQKALCLHMASVRKDYKLDQFWPARPTPCLTKIMNFTFPRISESPTAANILGKKLKLHYTLYNI